MTRIGNFTEFSITEDNIYGGPDGRPTQWNTLYSLRPRNWLWMREWSAPIGEEPDMIVLFFPQRVYQLLPGFRFSDQTPKIT